MNPLISVVVPFVNHKHHIRGCWENLQKQTYNNIEIIFVDNGSTDGSAGLVREIEVEGRGRIKAEVESRKGIPFARNKGLACARGNYITFLDVDDEFSIDKLAVLSKVMDEHPEAAMAYGQTLRIYENSGRKVIQDIGIAKAGINKPPELALDWTRNFYRLPQTGATLIRTDIAKKLNGFQENLLLGNDDVGFHIGLALIYPIIYHPFIAINYYRHERSEGARLNEAVSVNYRYLDAHLKSTNVQGINYFAATGDIRLLGLAQRGIFSNYITCFYKNKEQRVEPFPTSALFPFYRLMLFLFKLLPFSIAMLKYKVIRRVMNLFAPAKYPLH